MYMCIVRILCADPERFVRGGPTLNIIFFIYFLVEKR